MLALTGIGSDPKYPKEPDYGFRDRPHDKPFSGIAGKWYGNGEGGRFECPVVVKDGRFAGSTAAHAKDDATVTKRKCSRMDDVMSSTSRVFHI